MKQTHYHTEFVKRIPPKDELKDGVLYVCNECEVAVHKCMCGCGEEVVTPFMPDLRGQWFTEYNGITMQISLKPSIGNFQFSCKSHYYLTNGEVIWL